MLCGKLTNTVEKLEEKEMSISALKAELKDVNRARRLVLWHAECSSVV